MTPVKVHKLQQTDAFIVFDLAEAPASAGIVRLAPKILVDGATTLARSLTYLFATFEQQIGGASAGINAKPEDRAAAIEAFGAEVGPLVQAGTVQLQAGKGMGEDDLAPLRAVQAPGLDPTEARALLGVGVASAAARARGGLDGARVAVDGLDRSSVSVITELAAAGASVVAVATTAGTVSDAAGIDAARIAEAVAAHDVGAVEQLDLEVAPARAVFATDADILLTGSKVGAVDHDIAAGITAGLVVPTGPVPVTAKALAALRRSGTVVLPDFISAAGPWFAAFPGPPPTLDEQRAAVSEQVAAALEDVLGHDDGPVLAACYRAESFLRTWQDALPFGRPLA